MTLACEPLSPPAVSLGWLARRLGVTPRRVRAHVDWLMAHHGFPPPFPARSRRSECWDRQMVEDWIAQLAPGGLDDARKGRAPRRWGAVLDARAAGL